MVNEWSPMRMRGPFASPDPKAVYQWQGDAFDIQDDECEVVATALPGTLVRSVRVDDASYEPGEGWCVLWIGEALVGDTWTPCYWDHDPVGSLWERVP